VRQESWQRNNPSTWGTYEEALAAVRAGKATGIGFMLKDSEIAALDLDHVHDAVTGELVEWARLLLVEAQERGLYCEVTVSGTGLRFIGLVPNAASELHRKITVNRKNGAGIELYRNCARYITISSMQSGFCEDMAPIGDFLDELLVRFSGAVSPQLQPGTSALAPSNFFDFNSAGPQEAVDYQDLIENGAPEGERSEEFQRTVWHLASQGRSAEEIARELEQHPGGIGAKYAGRLLAEVQRSHGKWQRQRQTTTGASTTAGAPWPQIRIVNGEIPRVVAEAEAALLGYGGEIYQRGGSMVRPALTKFAASDNREAQGWHLVPVTRPYLVDVLTCAARFWQYNGRSKAWVSVDAPDKVAETYLARRGRWKLPVLTGIIHTPFLRADGSICETPGYDLASGLLLKPEGEHYPPIPVLPSKAEAKAALDELTQLIQSFAFVQDKDRSVALSAILTTLDRRSMPTAPLHAFTSPTAGTGKSLLVDVFAMLANGRPMPVISQGHNEEELEKRLGAALFAGDTAISLDNCDREVGGTFLCQVLTQQHLNIRILGLSRNVETPVNATIYATGNNLVIAGDATRRALLSAMDAGCERLETRVFADNVIDVARRHRGELVTAALTVLRAWHVAGERIGLSPFGSFEVWSRRIREPLVWLDQIDPCETLSDVRKSDPLRDALIAVLMQWESYLSVNVPYTVQEVIDGALGVPTFYMALMGVAPSRNGQLVNNISLGRWLRRVEGRIANRLALVQDGNSGGYPRWKLQRR
jgi:hypothetical protein